MRRRLSAARPLWRVLLLGAYLLLVLIVVRYFFPTVPGPIGIAQLPPVLLGIGLFSLLTAIGPRTERTDPVALAAPVRGRWVAMNSPGQGLPSHGTRSRGQYCAVDLCRPTTPSTPPMVRWGLRGAAPQEYPSFGEPIHAMAAGVVVRSRANRRDHRARNTWPALVYMLTAEAVLRELGGTGAVLGNHVIIEHDDGTFAAYAHLQRGSAHRQGERVEAGTVIGRIGNTGNTSMPHLHVQLMDRAEEDAAAGLVMTWPAIVRDGEIDPAFAKYAREPSRSAMLEMPRNGEMFTVEGGTTR
ncbi:MAG TPA: M23 family metallopeptidase [Beutenbergiaceae bacterium]|nr:M23 family metallopeptidase [Beutenbergiaceae bacterium]